MTAPDDVGEYYDRRRRQLQEHREKVLEPARRAYDANPTPENAKALKAAQRREEEVAYVGD